MANRRVRGVALIVQNPKGEILVLQEYESKPHFGKYCGMFSIPMETSEPNEADCCTIARLIKEELQGFDIPIDGAPEALIGSYRIVPRVWVKLFFIRGKSARLPNLGGLESKEVGNHRWLDPQKTLGLWLRQGAREMISDFISNKKGVLCRYCLAPKQK